MFPLLWGVSGKPQTCVYLFYSEDEEVDDGSRVQMSEGRAYLQGGHSDLFTFPWWRMLELYIWSQ